VSTSAPAALAPQLDAEQVTCLVADDHPVVLNAAAGYLESQEIAIAGRAADGDQALALMAATQPHVAVLNLRMPKLNGIEVARQARRVSPATATILYTGAMDQPLLTEAMDAGVRGFVLKQAPLQELLRAVRLVADGDAYIDPVLAGAMATAGAPVPKVVLTQREREVLRLLADGLSNEQIGKQLYIGAETVRTHIRKAMVKLAAVTRTEAVATALRMSLIS
jgi:DNA-binding NarL/FixJ family response regulator